MILLIAIVITRIEMSLCQWNYRSDFNGYGCIDAVNSRTALSPMAYRVLFPWLVGGAEALVPSLKTNRVVWLYFPLKIAALTWALTMVDRALGTPVMLLTALCLPLTFHFDYWDWAIELGATAAALTGNFYLAAIGGVLLALSRETAPLVPLAYWLITRDAESAIVLGLLTGLFMWLVREYVGKKRLYCERFMYRVNVCDVRMLFQNRPFYLSEIAMTMGLTALTVFALFRTANGTWLIPLMLLIAGWTMARAAEIRVFTPCLLWIAVALVK